MILGAGDAKKRIRVPHISPVLRADCDILRKARLAEKIKSHLRKDRLNGQGSQRPPPISRIEPVT